MLILASSGMSMPAYASEIKSAQEFSEEIVEGAGTDNGDEIGLTESEAIDENDTKEENSDAAPEIISAEKIGGEAYFTDIELELPEGSDLLTVDDGYDEGADELLSAGTRYWDKFSGNYFYDLMSAEEQKLYDQLYSINYEILTTDVDVSTDPEYSGGQKLDDDNYLRFATSSMSKVSVLKVARVFRLENPQFYFLNTSIISSARSDGIYVAIGVYDKFVDGQQRAEETAFVKDTIESWYDGIPENATDLGKEVYIQNKIVDSIIYDPRISSGGDPEDEQSRYNQSCYSVLGQDTLYTVCAGYAQTFELLMNGLDIDTVAITSYSHEWNKIKLYGRWYLTDVTWDDTKTNGSYRYTHFNISESYMDSIDQSMHSYYPGPYNIDGETVTYSNPKDHDETTGLTGYSTSDQAFLWPENLPMAETNVGSAKESAYGSYGGYSNTAADPLIKASASGGEYSITITCSTPGATVYYVTYDEDSDEPEEPSESYSKSRLYAGTFTVPEGTVVKAVACADGYDDSDVVALLAGTHTSSNDNNVSSIDSITITDSSRTLALAESVRLHAYAVPTYAMDSARKLYWFSDDESVVSVEASGASSEYATIKGLKAGTATITATTSSTNSGAVKAQCTVTVSGSSVSINRIKVTDQDGNTSSDINLKTNNSVSLSAAVNTGADARGQLVWSCDNEAVTLAPSSDTLSCEVTCNDAVTATVTATAGNGIKGSYQVNFYQPVEGLAFDKTDLYCKAGSGGSVYLYDVTVNVLGESNEVVSWSTTNPNVAYVYSYDESDSQHRTIKLATKNPGDTVLTASVPSGFSASCNIHVYDVAIESIAIVDEDGNTYASSSNYRNMAKGDEITLRISATPDDADYPEACEWNVYGYSSYVKLTDNKDGTCTIKVTGGCPSNTTYIAYVRALTYNYKSAYYYIHPYIPVTSVSLKDSNNKTSSDRAKGLTFDLTATVNSDCDQNLSDTSLTWSSSDESVANVTENSSDNKKATVTTTGVGIATITATAPNGVSGSYTVNSRAVHTVTFNANGGNTSIYDKGIPDGDQYGILPTPTRTGYTFAGWYTDAENGTRVSSTDIVTGNITLYAHWTAKAYTLTMYANGGVFSDNSTTSTKSITFEQPYGELPAPTRTGYDFKGWYTSTSGSNKVDENTVLASTTNQKIYAQWIPKTYTVTLDANGGECTKTDVTVTYDAYYPSMPTPTRTGYSFLGWYTDASGGTQITTSKKVSTADNQTLYAHWNVKTYTIRFNANGGNASDSYQQVTYGNAIGQMATATKSGYDFAGWYTALTDGEEITAATVVSEDLISSDSTTINVYAHWTAKQYTVTLDARGGSFAGGESLKTQPVTYGSVYGELPSPVRPGYDFVGWYTSTYNGTLITAESKHTITKDRTLYATWIASDYNVSFDANGGVCNSSGIRATYGSYYPALPTATRDGYTFDGWYTSKDGGTQVTTSVKVSQTADHTLYAHWTAKTYTLRYNSNGGNSISDSKIISFGSPFGELPEATRPGYDFAGWYTLADKGVPVTKLSTVSAENIDTNAKIVYLYAHWTAGKYTVTFDANGGEGSLTSKTVTNGETYGDLPTLARTGYDFAGWYTAKENGSVVKGDDIANLTGSITLYAHWSAKELTVTLEPNGGAYGSDSSPKHKQVFYGQSYGPVSEPSREGYAFGGWYTGAEGGTPVGETSVVTATEDHTLYAHWRAEEYTVTFDANGGIFEQGSGADVTISTRTATYDSAYGELPAPTREGYDFAGWFTEKSGGEAVTAETIVKIAGDHTIYARWNGAPHTVTFDSNGGELTGSDTKTVYHGNVYGELPVPQKEGHDFAGWFTEKEAGNAVTGASEVVSAANETLYAHWTAKKVTVTFDANGGKFNGNSTYKLSVNWGEAIDPDKVPKPRYSEHGFVGWYNEKNPNPETDEKYDFETLVEEDVILYAAWKKTYIGFKIDGLEEGHYVYSGTAVKPEFTVYYYDEDGKRELQEGRDYTVTYKNNTNAAAADAVNKSGASIAPSVTVKGKGNYTGTITETFTIEPRPISEAFTDNDEVVKEMPDDAYHLTLTCNNKDQKLNPVLKIVSGAGKTVTLKKGTDYTLYNGDDLVESVKEPGIYDITVRGRGNYTGERQLTVRVAVQTLTNISKVTFPSIPEQVYDDYEYTEGKVIAYKYVLKDTPERQVDSGEKCAVDKKGNDFYWTLTDKSKKPAHTLVYGEDYELFYSNNDAIGTATVTVIGKGNYYGSVNKTFKITGRAMSKVIVPPNFAETSAPNAQYDGKTKKFSYVGVPLEVAGPANEGANAANSEDYGIKLAYKENSKAEPEWLEKGKDYLVSYQKNTEPGTATVIFTGKGRYSGSIKKTFGISGYDLSKAKVTVLWKSQEGNKVWKSPEFAGEDDVPQYLYVKGGVKPEPILTFTYGDSETFTLEKGTDYTLSWSNTTKPAQYNEENKGKSVAPTVTITGKGRFSGKITRTFTINQGKLNVNLLATDVVYQKDKAGLYTKSKITVTDSSGQELKSGTDYYAANDKNHPFEYTFESFDFGTETKVTVKNGKAWEPVTVNKGGEVLPTYCIPAGCTIKVKVTGKGYYEGQEATGFFCFATGDFSKATAKLPDMTYTGREITAGELISAMSYDAGNPSNCSITLKNGKEISGLRVADATDGVSAEEQSEADCFVTGLSNNINIGTAKVTVKGNPVKGYAGEKTFTFKIKALGMNNTIVYYPGKVYEGRTESAVYKITGSMKQSSTPTGAKLTKNTYKVQKYDSAKNKYENASAKEVVFTGWNTVENPTGDNPGIAFSDQAEFRPSWTQRLAHFAKHGTGPWELYAQWEKVNP